MKKILKTVAALAATVTMLTATAAFSSITASAYSYNGLTYTISGNTVTITKCDNSRSIVTIPYKINGRKVTKIAKNAFKGCSNVDCIIIDNKNTVVDANAMPNYNGYIFWNRRTSLSSDGSAIPNSILGNVWVFGLGDTDWNGEVSLEDAMNILRYYTTVIVAHQDPGTDWEYFQALAICDVNRDGEISIDDAQNTLRYYTEHSVSMSYSGSFLDFMYDRYI